MKVLTKALFAGCFALATAGTARAGDNPMVAGVAIFADRTIFENAVHSADHTRLVAAMQAAGPGQTLQGNGRFTVYSPTNGAFAALPAGTVETLLKPENKDWQVRTLTCHVGGAKAMAAEVQKVVANAGGCHVIQTPGGFRITPEIRDGMVTLTDESGSVATVTIADVAQSNGVIHVIDKVLLPAG